MHFHPSHGMRHTLPLPLYLQEFHKVSIKLTRNNYILLLCFQIELTITMNSIWKRNSNLYNWLSDSVLSQLAFCTMNLAKVM